MRLTKLPQNDLATSLQSHVIDQLKKNKVWKPANVLFKNTHHIANKSQIHFFIVDLLLSPKAGQYFLRCLWFIW